MTQKKINIFRLLRYMCLVCVFSVGFITIVATGGGGDSSPTSSTGDGDTITGLMISGLASKGLISGGTVNVYEVNDDGQKGDLLGSTTTDSAGAYSLDIGDYDGPVLVEVTGGTYIDEATGETMDLDGTLRAALSSVSGDVDVAVTPLTEIAVRMAEAGGGLDGVKIDDANELLSQMIGADIISTMPADSSDEAAFGSATIDEQNYALLLAAISQMSNTSGQDVSSIIDAIEEDMGDLLLDDTSSDLLAAIDAFIASTNNNTGADDAQGLVGVINDIVANGFDPTGDLADVKMYLIDFLEAPTETNYTTLMTYMDFVADSAEAYLFQAMAELMDIYSNTEAVGFLTDNGLDLTSLSGEFDADAFLLDLLYLTTLDTDIADLFADLETRLGAVYSDLANAEGARTSISLTGFDTIYLDDIDVKILKTITNAYKSVCILVQAIDLGVDNWMVNSGTVDARTIIESGEDLTDNQIGELLNNNPNLFGWLDATTKLASFRTAIEDLADDFEAVVNALDALGIDGRVARLENAFNIDSDLDFYMAKSFSEETMESILTAMANSNASIVVPEDEYVGGSIVLEDDGYSYFLEEYDIYLITFIPAEGSITLYDLVNGDKSLRDLMIMEGDPYVEDGDPVAYMEGVEDIKWDDPIESFTVPTATITIDGDATDWESVPVFQSAEGFTVKIAKGDGVTCYAYLSIPAEFDIEADIIGCGIGAYWPWWPVEPTGNEQVVADFHNVELTISASEGGPPGSEDHFEVEEGDKEFIEDGEDIVGMEVKFSHFDLITADNYINFFGLARMVGGEPPPEIIIHKDMIKLY